MIVRRFRKQLAAGAAMLSLALAAVPAHAQWTVFDPSNFSQNVLTAARTLQQINNQITSLQNEAQGLMNQARNLANLPYSSLQALEQNIARTQQLVAQAQGIAYNVQNIDQAFATRYAPASASQTDAQLVAGAQVRWQQSVQALQDAMRTQATVVGNLDTNRAQMSALVTASQGATGALQATQAGNQLLALQAQQLSDLTAAVAAQGRAQALDSAQRQAASSQAQEQLRRFLQTPTGYQPSTVTMFHN
jgi:P-type conjugative transfer protein TrbJ